MKTIEEMIAVMTACKEGKKIQWANAEEDDWEDCPHPSWDLTNFDYRVKTEPKVRPYENAKEFLDAMKEHGPMVTKDGETFHIPVKAYYDRCDILTEEWISYVTLSEYYKWQDGTRCGVVEKGGEV